MKPIERIAAVTAAAAAPVTVINPDPAKGHPDAYTLPGEQLHRLLALAAEAAWAAAFIDRLWSEANEAAAFAKRQRDDTYPVHPDNVNYEEGEEPGPADPWSKGFHEGADYVLEMLCLHVLNAPQRYAPGTTSFQVGT